MHCMDKYVVKKEGRNGRTDSSKKYVQYKEVSRKKRYEDMRESQGQKKANIEVEARSYGRQQNRIE